MKPGAKPKLQIVFDGIVHYVCSDCEGVFPHTEFYIRKNGKIYSECRLCNKKRNKNYRDQIASPKIILGTPELESYIELTLQDLGL